MTEFETFNLDCEILTTERLVLRPPCADDIDDITAMANNIKIAKNLGTMPYPYFDADAKDFLDRIQGEPGCTYAITSAESGQMIGICGLHDANARYELPYTGYWLGEEHWGNGYATEAARALVDLYFKAGTNEFLMASCQRESENSRRVIEKCGGVFWKPGEFFAPALGENRAVDHYKISRESWMGAIAA